MELLKEHKINRQLVWHTVKRFQETGTIKDRSQSGRPTSKRSLEAIKRTREKIRRNPNCSIRKMAKEEKMSATTMAKIVKKDLKLKIYWKTKHHLISDATQAKRWVRSQVLL